MRKLILGIVLAEAIALVAVFAALVFGLFDPLRRSAPPVPAFRPPIYDAVIGEKVRYLRQERGETTGYLEYEVLRAVEYRGSTRGREFVMRLRELDAQGKQKRLRIIQVVPRTMAHGYLPPPYEEDDDFPTGARPVLKTLRTTDVALPRGMVTAKDRALGIPGNDLEVAVPGFLLEAVIPRDSLDTVVDRYWFSRKVAVFGVAKWERGEITYLLHSMEAAGS